MTTFVGDDVPHEETKDEVESPTESAREIITNSLEKMNNNKDVVSDFRLRLAKEDDLQTIEDLVQGLADYVNESDAVEMRAQDYRKDGFLIEDPLWYCLLVDRIDADGDSQTCGFAFVYFGYMLGTGRLMYLEDLYVKSEYRGGGGGKLMMKALAAGSPPSNEV